MSKYSKMVERKEKVEEHNKGVREVIGKYFLDLSKLFLTAISLAALSPLITGSKVSVNWIIVAVGFIASSFFAILGYRILKQR